MFVHEWRDESVCVMQVYENQCSTTKDQQCTTVYDTTYEDKCQTEYVR